MTLRFIKSQKTTIRVFLAIALLSCFSTALATTVVFRHWGPFENQGLTEIQLESCGVIGSIGDILGSNWAKVPVGR